jgi:hypothetical protein
MLIVRQTILRGKQGRVVAQNADLVESSPSLPPRQYRGVSNPTKKGGVPRSSAPTKAMSKENTILDPMALAFLRHLQGVGRKSTAHTFAKGHSWAIAPRDSRSPSEDQDPRFPFRNGREWPRFSPTLAHGLGMRPKVLPQRTGEELPFPKQSPRFPTRPPVRSSRNCASSSRTRAIVWRYTRNRRTEGHAPRAIPRRAGGLDPPLRQ